MPEKQSALSTAGASARALPELLAYSPIADEAQLLGLNSPGTDQTHGPVARSPAQRRAEQLAAHVKTHAPASTCHVHLLRGQHELLLIRPRVQVVAYNDHDSALGTLFRMVRLHSDILTLALAG